MALIEIKELHLHISADVLSGKAEILAALTSQGQSIMAVSEKTQSLIDEVASLKTTEESAITLIRGLAQRIEEADGDKAALDQIVSDLKDGEKALHDAVVASTPADPTTGTGTATEGQ